jgi:CTP synthase (UTP-ammonia lyase)
MRPRRIALVGDFSDQILAHRAINACLVLFNQGRPTPLEPLWVSTLKIIPGEIGILADAQGIWCVPGSPYRNAEGALWAIQYARTRSIPFLGTCGGYQHALIEFARNELQLKSAEHAEENPSAPLPLIHRMRCGLVEKSQTVVVTEKDFIGLYGAQSQTEGFHCSYGLNPQYEQIFDGTPMRIVARAENGEARAFWLKDHPFFIGTAFQPERRALDDSLHPLVAAFFSTVTDHR